MSLRVLDVLVEIFSELVLVLDPLKLGLGVG